MTIQEETALLLSVSRKLRMALSLGGSFLEFEGYYRAPSQTGYYGTFLWQGMVTFDSGRIQPVFYRMTAVAKDLSDLYTAWAKALNKAYEMMEQSLKMGRLVNYGLNGSPTRRFKSVEWQAFGQGLSGEVRYGQ